MGMNLPVRLGRDQASAVTNWLRKRPRHSRSGSRKSRKRTPKLERPPDAPSVQHTLPLHSMLMLGSCKKTSTCSPIFTFFNVLNFAPSMPKSKVSVPYAALSLRKVTHAQTVSSMRLKRLFSDEQLSMTNHPSRPIYEKNRHVSGLVAQPIIPQIS